MKLKNILLIFIHIVCTQFGFSQANFEHAPSGFKDRNSAIEHGMVTNITYKSTTVGTSRKIKVYTPPGYSKDQKYPVLYLLHGIGGDEGEWFKYTNPHYILDNLYAKGKLAPMIVVFPNGRAMVNDAATGDLFAGDKVAAFDNFEYDLINDLNPFIEANYHVLIGPENRAIAGFSMGGGQSLNFGLRHLDLFSYIGGMSPAPNTKTHNELITNIAIAKEKINLLWLSCGESDGLIYVSRDLHNFLDQNGIDNLWYPSPGGHSMDVWENDLYYFSQLLFKSKTALVELVDSSNIALNKPVNASGDALPNWGHRREYANDGDFNTRWQGSEAQGSILADGRYADKSWWSVDLEQKYTIEGIRISWETAFAIAYNIDVSNDGLTWQTIYSQQNGHGHEELLTFKPVKARYVRISTIVGNMEWYPSFYEFEVYEQGKISYDSFSLDFDRTWPSFVRFKSDVNAYTNSLTQFAPNDSILLIQGSPDIASTKIRDTLAIDFGQNFVRNLSSYPVIYLKYKAEENFNVQVDVKISDSVTIALNPITAYKSENLTEQWIKLEIPKNNLSNVLGININVQLLGEYKVYIDKIVIGRTAPEYKLQFRSPAKGEHFIEGDKITAGIGAISGKVQYSLDNKLIKEIANVPYDVNFPDLKSGLYRLTAKLLDEDNAFIDSVFTYFAVSPEGGTTYRDANTEKLYANLKATANLGYPMFGMQMPTTRTMAENIKFSYQTSDCKDIVGSHPAFHEADFSNYGGSSFKDYELFSLKEAVKRGAVVGFCWHIGGMHSGDIYVNDDRDAPDANLVHEIVSDTNRITNPALDWLYTRLDEMAIPIFKGMGCPVIFRPWHEMTGSWFWWGSLNKPEEIAQLFALTVDYIRSKGVRNVLYCWAPNLSTDFRFYPGDEYVDVLGYDAYQIGVASYASKSKVLSDLSFLTDYAQTHNMVTAITETGLDQSNGYTSKYPAWWTEKVLEPILGNKKAKRLAWIEAWCNSGTYWIPYKGIKGSGATDAIADFKNFYNHPATIFENDVPDMYGFNHAEDEVFIYPGSVEILKGQSIQLFGGTVANWATDEKKIWSSSNDEIAFIDADGNVTALKKGNVTIKLTINETLQTTIKLLVGDNDQSKIEDEMNLNEFEVYPNPSSNGFTIYSPLLSEKKIELRSFNGQLIDGFSTKEQQIYMDTKNITSGVYFLSISYNHQKAIRKIMFKQ